jgi:hypothetical protein
LRISGGWTGWNQVPVELAHPSSISPGQEKDHCRRGQADELEQNEYRLATVHSQCTDEQAADQPHRPRTVADSDSAVLSPEVDYLRHIGDNRDHDSSSTKDLKHRLPFGEGDAANFMAPCAGPNHSR